jgi:hypothetical protein
MAIKIWPYILTLLLAVALSGVVNGDNTVPWSTDSSDSSSGGIQIPHTPVRTGNEFTDTYNAAKFAKEWIPMMLAPTPEKFLLELGAHELKIPGLLDLVFPEIAGQSDEGEQAMIESWKQRKEETKSYIDNQPSFPDGFAHSSTLGPLDPIDEEAINMYDAAASYEPQAHIVNEQYSGRSKSGDWDASPTSFLEGKSIE